MRQARFVLLCIMVLAWLSIPQMATGNFLAINTVVVSTNNYYVQHLQYAIMPNIYHCSVDVSDCEKEKLSEVCGINGETYNSRCELHKARVPLAYTGACRPHLCKDQVCGVDKNTYFSICHAHARNVGVDHFGKCFPSM